MFFSIFGALTRSETGNKTLNDYTSSKTIFLGFIMSAVPSVPNRPHTLPSEHRLDEKCYRHRHPDPLATTAQAAIRKANELRTANRERQIQAQQEEKLLLTQQDTLLEWFRNSKTEGLIQSLPPIYHTTMEDIPEFRVKLILRDPTILHIPNVRALFEESEILQALYSTQDSSTREQIYSTLSEQQKETPEVVCHMFHADWKYAETIRSKCLWDVCKGSVQEKLSGGLRALIPLLEPWWFTEDPESALSAVKSYSKKPDLFEELPKEHRDAILAGVKQIHQKNPQQFKGIPKRFLTACYNGWS